MVFLISVLGGVVFEKTFVCFRNGVMGGKRPLAAYNY